MQSKYIEGGREEGAVSFVPLNFNKETPVEKTVLFRPSNLQITTGLLQEMTVHYGPADVSEWERWKNREKGF